MGGFWEALKTLGFIAKGQFVAKAKSGASGVRLLQFFSAQFHIGK
jgi:hypothetical protein